MIKETSAKHDSARNKIMELQSSIATVDLGSRAPTKLMEIMGEFMKEDTVMKEVYTESIVEHNKCQIEKFSAADKSVQLAILALNSTNGKSLVRY
jgi:hypothetical protein